MAGGMMIHCWKNWAAIAALSSALSAAGAQVAPEVVQTRLITEKSIAMRYEIEAAKAAIDACSSDHVRAVVVMVDSLGNTMLQMVGDRANYNLLDEARRKARTAAMTRRNTADLQKDLAANPKMRIPPDPDFLVMPGGAPFRAGEEVVGAIGVAGGGLEQDDKCAQTGIEEIGHLLH
jgi:uncharacterized protein GlcG (DUF336 family)